MARNNASDEPRIYHRNVYDGNGSPSMLFVRTVANLKDVEGDELSQLYSCIGDMIEDFYSTPPVAAANVEITFSYEGFRITLYQDGHAVFQRLGEDGPSNGAGNDET